MPAFTKCLRHDRLALRKLSLLAMGPFCGAIRHGDGAGFWALTTGNKCLVGALQVQCVNPKDIGMTFKHMLLSSAVAGSFLLPVTLTNPAVFPLTAEAQAAINVSINIGIGTFYDRLSPYGNWVFYHDRYVWLPGHVSVRWQPYTEGHWVYTRRYGWLWVSDERFGWATYHYGRWGYARDIGWYWVPGRRWAPAWVVWCHGDDDIAWAPLPPDYDNDLNITISFGDIPDYYWQAVPASAFLSFDLSGRVTRDRDHVRSVIQGGNQQSA